MSSHGSEGSTFDTEVVFIAGQITIGIFIQLYRPFCYVEVYAINHLTPGYGGEVVASTVMLTVVEFMLAMYI